MRLTLRDDIHFRAIKSISDVSFDRLEIPPEDTLRYHFNQSEVFVHETYAGEIVSYVMVVRQPEEPYVWSVATLPEFRGHGLASKLMSDAIEWFRISGAKRMELTVNVDNPAQKLYFDLGFRVVTIFKKYYGEASGLRMRRYL